MNKAIWAIAILLGLDVLLVGGFIAQELVCASGSFSISDLGPLVVGAGVLVALLSLGLTMRRNRSEDYLESAGDLLEKAYETLADLDEEGRPKNSRRNWLTAARLIRISERIGNQITDESHKTIYRERTQYWRGRIHDLIFPSVEGYPKEYYAEKPEHMYAWIDKERAPLSERSLGVLYRFIKWPEGIPDPIADEKHFSDEEIEKMRLFGPRGLGELLDAAKELRPKKKPEGKV